MRHPMPPHNSLHASQGDFVLRTQRVVQQRAVSMQQRRSRTRSLWIPIGICSILLVSIFYTAWKLLSLYDLTPTGIPDSNYQLVFILIWSLPVTAAILGLVWLQRGRQHGRDEVR